MKEIVFVKAKSGCVVQVPLCILNALGGRIANLGQYARNRVLKAEKIGAADD
jgi:hypothetical protein